MVGQKRVLSKEETHSALPKKKKMVSKNNVGTNEMVEAGS